MRRVTDGMNTATGVAHRATATEERLRRFAVKGVFWRRYLDWAVVNLPFFFYPVNVFFFTLFFFFFAAPARRAIMANLAVVLPGSSRTMNYLRAFRTLSNFAWTLSEAAIYRILHEEFSYEIVGAEWLEQVGAAPGAIVLVAKRVSACNVCIAATPRLALLMPIVSCCGSVDALTSFT